MQVDKKQTKLNTRQNIDKLTEEFEIEERNIHDKYYEMYRILFQAASTINKFLLDIIEIAQKIIDFPNNINIQNVQIIQMSAQNIKKELEYYVDPNDIQGMSEHVVSSTNITNAIRYINDTIYVILENFEKGVDINDILNIQQEARAIIDAFERQEERIKKESNVEDLIRNIELKYKDNESNNIEDIITTLFKEFIERRFEDITPFFKEQLDKQNSERYLRRLFEEKFDVIKNSVTEDVKEDVTKDATGVFKSMDLPRTDEVIKKLREHARVDMRNEVVEVTRTFSNGILDAIKSTKLPEGTHVTDVTGLVDKLASEIVNRLPKEMRVNKYSDKIKTLLTPEFEKIDSRIREKIEDDDIINIAEDIIYQLNIKRDKNSKKSRDDLHISLLKGYFIEKCIDAYTYGLTNNDIPLNHANKFAGDAEFALANLLVRTDAKKIMPILSPVTTEVPVEFGDRTEILSIYQYIVLTIVNATIGKYAEITKKYTSAKKINEQVGLTVISDAENMLEMQILEILEINKNLEVNDIDNVIIEQIIAQAVDTALSDNLIDYINQVVQANEQEIMNLIQEKVSGMNLNNYFRYILYKCQNEYAIIRESCELLLIRINEHKELTCPSSLKDNLIRMIEEDFAIFRAQHNVIITFKRLTEEDTDIYDILLTMFTFFTDVFNKDYFVFLIEKTKILEEEIECSEFKYITIYYMLDYARSKLSPVNNANILYALSFDMHNLRFIYDMNTLLSRIDPDRYNSVHNTLSAYYHFQNILAKLTNDINKLNDDDKNVIRAIMYIIYRMKYPTLVSTTDVHNYLYTILNETVSACNTAVANGTMYIDGNYYIFTNTSDFNSSLNLFATYICYYFIFVEVYDIFTDDTQDAFLTRITNINIINTCTSSNEYENIRTKIQERLLEYKLLKIVDVKLLSRLLNNVNDAIQKFVRNNDISNLINEIIRFVEDNVTVRNDEMVEVKLDIDEYNVEKIQNAILHLCTLPIYKYIQKANITSPLVRHAIELFNIIYECVLTSDEIVYKIISKFIHKLNYFNIGQEIDTDVLPYNPELALKDTSHTMDALVYRILSIYFYNKQLIIDNLTANRTEFDRDIEKICIEFYNMVRRIMSSESFDIGIVDVLRASFGTPIETVVSDEYTEPNVDVMKDTFGVDFFNADYHDDLHNMTGGNVVYDTTYFIKNELPNIQRDDDLHGGMYTPAHEMLELDMDFERCRKSIKDKVTPKIESTLNKACYVDVSEGVSSVVNGIGTFNDAKKIFHPLIKTIKDYLIHAIDIGFEREFTNIEKLPLLYKPMYGYFQTALHCAICKKDINTLKSILPLSKHNPSKVIFYEDFNHVPYVDIIPLIYNKLEVNDMRKIYEKLLHDVTDAVCYTEFNVCIAVQCFAALVYYATVVHYLNLPIHVLREIFNLDKRVNVVQIDSMHKFLFPVREDIVTIVNNSVKDNEMVSFEFKSGRKNVNLKNKRIIFTDEILLYMFKLLQTLYNTDFTARNLCDKIPFYIYERDKQVNTKLLLGVANLVYEGEQLPYENLHSRYKSARDLEQEYSKNIHGNMENINTHVLMFERKIANSIIGLIYKHMAFNIYDSLTPDAKAKVNDIIKTYLDTLKDALIYSRCYDIDVLNGKLDLLKTLIDNFKDALPTTNILQSFDVIFIVHFDKECYDILVNKLEDIITSAIRTYYFDKYDYKTKVKNESVDLVPYPDENYDVVKAYTLNNYPKTITGFASLIQAYEGLISPYISFLIYLLSNNLGNRMLSSNPSPKIHNMDKVDQFIHSMENTKTSAITGGLAYDGEIYKYNAVTKVKTFSPDSMNFKRHFQRTTNSRYELLLNKKLCSYDMNVLTDEILDKLINILKQINFTKARDDTKEWYTPDCIENIKAILGGYGIRITDIPQDHIESLEKLKTFMFNIVLPSMNLCVHDGKIVPVNVCHVEIDRRTFEQVVVCIDRNKAAGVTESNFKVELLRRLIMRVYTIGREESYKMVPESVIIISAYKHLNATVCRNLQLDFVRKHYPQFNRLLVFIVDDDDVLNPLTAYYVLTEAIHLNYTTNVIISNQDTSKLNLYVDGKFVSRYAVWSILWSPFIYNVSIRCMPMNKEDQALHATIVAYNVNAITSDICEAAKSGRVEVMYKYNSPIIRQASDSRYSKHAEFENPYAIKYANAVIENDQGFYKVIVPVSTHTSASARKYAYTTGKFVLNDSSKNITNQNLYGLPLLMTDGRKIVDNEIVRPLDDYADFENEIYTNHFNSKHTPRHKNRENLNGDAFVVFYVASQRSLLYDDEDYQIVDKRGEFVTCQDGKLTSIEKLRKLIAGDIDDYYDHEIENDFTRSLMKCNRDELRKYVEILINEMLNPDFYLWNTYMKIFYENIANWLNLINNARHITEHNANIFVPDKVRGGNANVLNIVIKIILIIAIVLMIVVIISIIVICVQKQSKIKQIIYRHNPIKHKY